MDLPALGFAHLDAEKRGLRGFLSMQCNHLVTDHRDCEFLSFTPELSPVALLRLPVDH